MAHELDHPHDRLFRAVFSGHFSFGSTANFTKVC